MMLEINPTREAAAEIAIRDFVFHRVALGIYDPLRPRRTKVAVETFQIELLEFDEAASIVHVAGPIVLLGEQGPEERFLRLSVSIRFEGDVCFLAENGVIRAVYVEETNHPDGACKETAALANA